MESCHAETLSLINMLMPVLHKQAPRMTEDQAVAYDRLVDTITDWGFEVKE